MRVDSKHEIEKILSKVDKLEKEIEKRDLIIDKLQESRGGSEPLEEGSEFPPMPKTNDRLAKALIRGARKKLRGNKDKNISRDKQGREITVEEVRKNYHLGEIMIFVKKKGIPLGKEENDEEEGDPATVIIED